MWIIAQGDVARNQGDGKWSKRYRQHWRSGLGPFRRSSIIIYQRVYIQVVIHWQLSKKLSREPILTNLWEKKVYALWNAFRVKRSRMSGWRSSLGSAWTLWGAHSISFTSIGWQYTGANAIPIRADSLTCGIYALRTLTKPWNLKQKGCFVNWMNGWFMRRRISSMPAQRDVPGSFSTRRARPTSYVPSVREAWSSWRMPKWWIPLRSRWKNWKPAYDRYL